MTCKIAPLVKRTWQTLAEALALEEREKRLCTHTHTATFYFFNIYPTAAHSSSHSSSLARTLSGFPHKRAPSWCTHSLMGICISCVWVCVCSWHFDGWDDIEWNFRREVIIYLLRDDVWLVWKNIYCGIFLARIIYFCNLILFIIAKMRV